MTSSAITDSGKSEAASNLSSSLALLLVLILLVPPLFIEVHRPTPTRMMESLSFLSSQETWLRLHTEGKDAWKMPTWNGRPRIQKPPLLVWLNLLAWRGLSPERASVDDLTARARWLAAALSVVSVLAVFWLGGTLGGRDLALISSLATGLSIGFVRQARYASYDTHLIAWTAIAAAAAVWACRSNRSLSLRNLAGWSLAAAALAAANLTKGPLGFALITPAWLGAVWLLSTKRLKEIGTMLAALALNAAVLLLWFAAARKAVPNAADLLRSEYGYIFEISRIPLFYVIVIPLVFPWTLWLAAGVVGPLWRRSLTLKRETVFAWVWFAAVFVLLSLSPVKNKRYLAPLFPAAGLLTATAWLTLARASSDSRAAHLFTKLNALHWTVLGIVTALLPLYAAVEPWALRMGLVRHAALGTYAWIYWSVVPCILLPVVGLGVWLHRRRRYMAAAICTAAWFSVAATFGFFVYARLPRQQYAFRKDAETLATYARHAPIYYISRFKPPYHESAPGHALVIYFRGVIRPIHFDQLLVQAGKNERFFVLTRLDGADEERLKESGFHYVREIRDDHEPAWKLWAANMDPESGQAAAQP